MWGGRFWRDPECSKKVWLFEKIIPTSVYLNSAYSFDKTKKRRYTIKTVQPGQ